MKRTYNSSIHKAGFTLVELVVTISIAVIVMTAVVPAFKETIRNNRLATQTNRFVTALSLARSEAAKRGMRVTVGKIGAEWENGWRVFSEHANAGSYGTFDSDGTVPDDEELQTYEPLDGAHTLRGSANFTNYISFLPSGVTNSTGSFVLCDNSDGDNLPDPRTARMLIVNLSGNVQKTIDNDDDGIPEDNNGDEINSCVPPFAP